jgi:hypothetical protein
MDTVIGSRCSICGNPGQALEMRAWGVTILVHACSERAIAAVKAYESGWPLSPSTLPIEHQGACVFGVVEAATAIVGPDETHEAPCVTCGWPPEGLSIAAWGVKSSTGAKNKCAIEAFKALAGGDQSLLNRLPSELR